MFVTSTTKMKLLSIVMALALAMSSCGAAMAPVAFAGDTDDASVLEELGELKDAPFIEDEDVDGKLADGEDADPEDADGESADPEDADGESADPEDADGELADGEDADGALADAEETNAEGDAGNTEGDTEADGTTEAPDSEGDTALSDEAADAAPNGLTAALASEPVALADYPDGIEWHVVKNYYEAKAEAEAEAGGGGEVITPSGTCVWGMDGSTLYIRPPDGATTGTLPSLMEAKEYTIPTVPWERKGVTKAVILPGVIAGEECQLFHNLYRMTEIVGLENLDISHTKSLVNMFFDCRALKSIELPDWNAPELVTMAAMFDSCEGLENLTFSNMYTPNVTDLAYMFHYCKNIKTVDLSNMDVPLLEDMHGMFWQDAKLTSVIWPSTLDTSKVTNMERMFDDCKALTEVDLSKFDTRKVETMEMMFRQSGIQNIDISSFRTDSLKNTNEMFYLCKDIVFLDLSEFATENIEQSTNMFPNSSTCPKWVKVSGKFTLDDQLNKSKNWYKVEGTPCDNHKITSDATGEYVLIEKVVLEQISPQPQSLGLTMYLPLGTQPIKLKATVVTALPLNEPVTWGTTSFNSAAIEVDENDPNICTVTMPNSGKAQVSAMLYGVTGYFTLYVVELSTNKTKYVSVNTSTFDLVATTNPSTVNDPVTWTIDDKTIAEPPTSTTKPNKAATFKVKKVGTAKITATCNGTKGVGASTTCALTVVDMSLDESSKATYFGEEPFTLTPTIEPAGVPGNVTWSSSDESVATVDENGVVTTHKKGSATITASLDSVANVTASCALSVQNAVVTMAEKEKTVGVSSQPFSLSATVMPTSVTQPLAWTSSDDSVATVDQTGNVTVHDKTGTATITASCADAKDSCLLTVASLTLSEHAKTVGVDASPFKLTATIQPPSTGIATWASSNNDVATVDSDGNVTVKGAGTTKITAEYAGAKDVFDLTVISIDLGGGSMAVREDAKPFVLTAAVTPSEFADDLSLSSSDPNVATIERGGLAAAQGPGEMLFTVTPHSVGTTTLTATTNGITSTCTLAVYAAPVLHVNDAARTVLDDVGTFTLTATVEPSALADQISWESSDPSVASIESVTTIPEDSAGALAMAFSEVFAVVLAEEDSDDTASTSEGGYSTCTVRVHGVGTTDITATVDGVSSVCALTVEKAPEPPAKPDDPEPPAKPNEPEFPAEIEEPDSPVGPEETEPPAESEKPDGSSNAGESTEPPDELTEPADEQSGDGLSNEGDSSEPVGEQSGDEQESPSQEPGSRNGSSVVDLLTEKTPLSETGDDTGLLIVTTSMALSTSIILLLVSRRCFMSQGRHARRAAR